MTNGNERIEPPESDEKLRQLLLRLQRLESSDVPLDREAARQQANGGDASRIEQAGSRCEAKPTALAWAARGGLEKYRTQLAYSFIGGFLSIFALTLFNIAANKLASRQAETLNNSSSPVTGAISRLAANPPAAAELTLPNFVPASYTSGGEGLKVSPLSGVVKWESLFGPAPNTITPSPHILAVAARIEARIDREVRFFISVDNVALLPPGTNIVILGLPEYIALTPAQSLGYGTWVLDPAAAGDVRMTMYAAPVRDIDVVIELVTADGKLIANSRTTLATTRNPIVEAPIRAGLAAKNVSLHEAAIRAVGPRLALRQQETGQRIAKANRLVAVPVVRAAARSHRRAAQSKIHVERALVWPGDNPPVRRAASADRKTTSAAGKRASGSRHARSSSWSVANFNVSPAR